MDKIIPIVVLVVVIFILKVIFGRRQGGAQKETSQKTPYVYLRKEYLMTRAENEFYKKLEQAVEGQYYIFPQVHLDSVIDYQVKGQNWKGALSHIQRKSVDYVICDKANFKPLVAIELDDFSHDRADRRDRDTEVERILQQAHLPLLRFANGSDDVATIKDKLMMVLNS